MTLDELVTQLRSAHGEDLRAVVLYGSAAAGDHLPKRSDYNILVIVDQLPLSRYPAAAAVSSAWVGAGNPAPMVFTTAEWNASSDIFPMEYADILERHRVLHGRPPFDGVRVERSDLRLQVEHESMGKLLHLRRLVLGAGTDAKRRLEVLERTLSGLMVVFRGAVRLAGDESVPAMMDGLSERVGALAGFSPAPFIRVVRHVRNEERIAGATVDETLAGVLDGMEKLVAWVDRFSASHGESPPIDPRK